MTETMFAKASNHFYNKSANNRHGDGWLERRKPPAAPLIQIKMEARVGHII